MSQKRFYGPEKCRSKADQHWEMAGMARSDGDMKDARRHEDLARLWDNRTRAGGWEEGEDEH